jgi:hypothetical protein
LIEDHVAFRRHAVEQRPAREVAGHLHPRSIATRSAHRA